MNEDFPKLSRLELNKLLIEEIQLFVQKIQMEKPLDELRESRKNIQRIFKLLETEEEIELKDIFGNRFVQILMRES